MTPKSEDSTSGLKRAHPLLAYIRSEGAPQHRGIIGEDHALHPRDDPDAEHSAAADRVGRAVCRERADLEEGAVGVQGQGDALAHGQLAALGQALVVVGATAELGLVEEGVDLLELLEHGIPILAELGGAWVESGVQGRSE